MRIGRGCRQQGRAERGRLARCARSRAQGVPVHRFITESGRLPHARARALSAREPGERTRTQVDVTVSQGCVVWEGGQLHVRQGAGRFLPLPTGGPLFAGLDRLDASYVERTYPYGPVPVRRAATGAAKARDEL
jgi:hypothetical protein